MALNMAMITISWDGEMTEAERARTSPAKSSKIPFGGRAVACRRTGDERQRRHEGGLCFLLSG